MRPLLILLAAGLLAGPVTAQDTRLAGRIEAATLARITSLVEQAAARGLPTEPLVQKALEGASKGAAAAHIERAVRGLADRLEAARAQLGNAAPEAELVAAASALYVGVAPAALARLRALRPHDSLAMPLIALTFFVQRGVAVDASIRWVESMVSAKVAPDEMLKLQQMIESDVRAGAEARAASETRVEALLLRYRSER
jgi:hypothetical protein